MEINQIHIDKLSEYVESKLTGILFDLASRNPIIESVFKFKDKDDLIVRLSVALALSASSNESIISRLQQIAKIKPISDTQKIGEDGKEELPNMPSKEN